MMIGRGRDSSKNYRVEFSWSKAANLQDSDRAHYEFRPMTADERAAYDGQLVTFETEGRGRKSKQRTVLHVAEASLDAICRHLTVLENYGVTAPDGSVTALDWAPGLNHQQRRELLSQMHADDRAEIIEHILGETEISPKLERDFG